MPENMGQQSRRVLIADGVITKSVDSEVLELLTADDEKNAPSASAGRFIDRPEGDDRTGLTAMTRGHVKIHAGMPSLSSTSTDETRVR